MSRKRVPLAAVIGHPVAHSLSPLIFATLAARERKRIEYRRIDVPPAMLRTVARGSAALQFFIGWNITIPHKQAIARLCDRLSPEARAAGAVNVVRFEKGGKLAGFNTDILGIERTLADHRVRVRGARVLVFGAGGAALAAGYALARGGAREVVFANRTASRARAAASRLARALPAGSRTRFGVARWPGRAGADAGRADEVYDLYVNATSLGLAGGAGPGRGFDPFPRGRLQGAAFDVVYVPENTLFLRAARRRGLRAIGGLDMLIWQAIATWELWFGPLGARRRRALKSDLQKVLGRALRAELRQRKS